MRPVGSAVELERRRKRAIDLLEKGHAPVEVARMLGVDRRSVRRWNAAYRDWGETGLALRPASGRPPKLEAKQRARLEKILIKGARAAGFPTELWTCPRVAQVIYQRFGVHYHVDHICRLLHGLGWSPQKPQRRAVERDEKAIGHWVETQWPRIKKKRRA